MMEGGIWSEVERRKEEKKRIEKIEKKKMRKRIGDEIVRKNIEEEELIDIIVIGSEEDERKIGIMEKEEKKINKVNERNIDIEDRKIGRKRNKKIKRRREVGIGLEEIKLRIKRNGKGGKDVEVIIKKRNSMSWRRLINEEIIICWKRKI